MKKTKLMIFKRIFVLFCSTLLLITNIFLSYNTVLHASDDYDIIDAADDLLNICLVIGGIIFSAPSGGLSYLATIKGIIGLRDSAENLIDYITDNGDGTYTIDESLIQAALQAAEQLEALGFTDKNVEQQKSGYLYNYKWTVSNSYLYKVPNQSVPVSCHYTYIRSCEIKGRVAGFNSVFTNSDGITTYSHSVYNSSLSVVTAGGQGIFKADGEVDKRDISSSVGDTLVISDGSEPYQCYSGTSSFGGNFPIFSTFEALSQYIATGQGYKNAENYRPTPLFRRHSSYNPTYTGGAVTVNRTVINNINSKITEVDADDSLSDDQKIEILQQYIFSGGVNPTPTPPPTPSDPDYDDNKDLPSGTDLTDTNSWLKKIYLKVCQIYAKMNAAVEDAEDAALAKIQESLDEIITQLKKIKRWTAVDTVIDGVDAIADWLDLIRGVISDGEEGVGAAVSTVAESLADSADSLSTKFPFSIPWDILFFISVLAAEPQVPYFEIPMDIEMEWLDINIHYDFVIDFSQFQWLSDLSRLVLSMTYAVGLLKLTMNIALLKKEE